MFARVCDLRAGWGVIVVAIASHQAVLCFKNKMDQSVDFLVVHFSSKRVLTCWRGCWRHGSGCKSNKEEENETEDRRLHCLAQKIFLTSVNRY